MSFVWFRYFKLNKNKQMACVVLWLLLVVCTSRFYFCSSLFTKAFFTYVYLIDSIIITGRYYWVCHVTETWKEIFYHCCPPASVWNLIFDRYVFQPVKLIEARQILQFFITVSPCSELQRACWPPSPLHLSYSITYQKVWRLFRPSHNWQMEFPSTSRVLLLI